MPSGRPRSQPSLRNLEIYHEIVYLECPQAEVAVQFHVSPPRAAAICQQVKDWVEALLPPDVPIPAHLAGDPAFRFHLALALRRHQLTNAYAKYLDAFGGQRNAADMAPIVAAWREGTLSPEISYLLPSRHFVERAVQMAQELDGLANLALRGPFSNLPDQFFHDQQLQPLPGTDTPADATTESGPVVLPLSDTVSPCATITPNH